MPSYEFHRSRRIDATPGDLRPLLDDPERWDWPTLQDMEHQPATWGTDGSQSVESHVFTDGTGSEIRIELRPHGSSTDVTIHAITQLGWTPAFVLRRVRTRVQPSAERELDELLVDLEDAAGEARSAD